MNSLSGTRLGRYEILAEIGRGSMGIVYRARDPKIDREVAIKTISLAGQDPEEEKEYRARFVNEAKAAGRLSHPGIVTIYDIGEQPETHEPYIVMEYVAGESLNKILNREAQKVPLEPSLQICKELAEALHYAHSQGVIHRDIKPANILVTAGAHPKIADFGVAKLNLSGLTLPGQIIGSPAFMAPEQLSGEDVDARADLFALGVILYNMLTGYRPFQGNSTSTVCFKLLNRDPLPVTALNSELPSEIDGLVARAMAKDPAERFQSGAEMAQAIQAFMGKGAVREERPVAVAAYEAMGKRPRGENTAIAAPANDASTERATKSQPSAKPLPAKAGFKITDSAYIGVAVAVLLVAGALAIYRGSRSAKTPVPQAPVAVNVAAPSLAAPVTQAQTASLDDPNSADSSDQDSAPEEVVAKKPAPPVKHPKPHIAKTPAPSLQALKNDPTAGVRTLPVATSASLAPAPAVSTPPTAPAPKPQPTLTNLRVDFEHSFPDGEATIWVDNQLLLTQVLHAEQKKHALIFKRLEGRESKIIQVAAGQHTIHVRVHATDDSFDQSETVTESFDATRKLALHIVCGKHGNEMKLNLQDLSAQTSPPNNE